MPPIDCLSLSLSLLLTFSWGASPCQPETSPIFLTAITSYTWKGKEIPPFSKCPAPHWYRVSSPNVAVSTVRIRATGTLILLYKPLKLIVCAVTIIAISIIQLSIQCIHWLPLWVITILLHNELLYILRILPVTELQESSIDINPLCGIRCLLLCNKATLWQCPELYW